jgi:hypothetical protein
MQHTGLCYENNGSCYSLIHASYLFLNPGQNGEIHGDLDSSDVRPIVQVFQLLLL